MLSGLFDKAVQHHRAGEFDKAIALYRACLRTAKGADASRVLQMLAAALQQTGQSEQAEESLRSAIRAEPAPAIGARGAMAMFLSGQARLDEAIAVWREAVAVSGGNRSARLGLAQQLAEARRADESLAEIQSLVKDFPGDPAVQYELGRLCERLGRNAEARTALSRVLASGADLPEAAMLLARLDAAEGHADEARQRLEKLIAELTDHRRGVAMMELAKLLDKMGQYELAFEMARRGQAVNLSALPAGARDGRLHERVMDGCLQITREQVAGWARAGEAETSTGHKGTPGPPTSGRGSGAPVFVVGFPRSGTTLLEQMLSAHPRLVVTDEFPILQRVREKMFVKFRPRGEYPRDLGLFTAEQVAAGRTWYLERAEAALGSDRVRGRRIVDKQPLNTIDLCLVRLLFPESPVVFVKRDPRDTVLSCFMQGFTRGVPHLFTLEGTVRLHERFMKIWAHYQQVLGLRAVEVAYEDLAREPQRVIREVLGFIGEEWDDAVMRSHDAAHRRYVVTPSYSDVTQPVHTRSIGRWEKYRVQLGEGSRD